MTHRKSIALVLAFTALALVSAPAYAGMPAPYSLRDLPRMRLEAISFFLAVLLVSSKLIQLIWNGVRSPVSRVPWLSYPRALGLVVLWGLLFSVVLAMISGARELMTPGAWEQRGATYRLKDGPR